MENLYDNTVFVWVILPVIIFFSRILDVTLGTLRIIFVSRGKKYQAPLLGFFEVLVWLTVITSIMENAKSWICYIAYAGGFAAGNYAGILIEEKLAIGILSVRIFVSEDKIDIMTRKLAEKGFGVTLVKGAGQISETHIIHCIIRRKEFDEVVSAIHDVDDKLFYCAEELKHVNKGIFLDQSCCKK